MYVCTSIARGTLKFLDIHVLIRSPSRAMFIVVTLFSTFPTLRATNFCTRWRRKHKNERAKRNNRAMQSDVQVLVAYILVIAEHVHHLGSPCRTAGPSSTVPLLIPQYSLRISRLSIIYLGSEVIIHYLIIRAPGPASINAI